MSIGNPPLILLITKTMQHALLISPVSQLPTIVNSNSKTYAELMQAGYQPIQTGTKKQLEEIEEEMLEQFVDELETNFINN